MITFHRGTYRVTTPDGFLVGITTDQAVAEQWDRMLSDRRLQVNVSLPVPLAEQFRAEAERLGVAPSSLALSLIQSHVLGVRLRPEKRKTGAAARHPAS